MELGVYQGTAWVVAILAIYLVGMLYIGFICSKRISDTTDYIVAGRRLPLFYTVGTLFATWFCAGTVMGGAANAYLFGNQGVIFDPWGAALCLALAGLLFLRIMRRGKYITLADIFTIRYGRQMGLLSAITLSIGEAGWVGAQLVGFGTILQIFAGIPLAWGITISSAVLIIYTYMGGMWSVTLTDVVQMIILTVGILLLFPQVISHVGGWDSFVANAGDWAQIAPFAMVPTAESGFLGYTGSIGWIYYVAAWLSLGFGSIPAQDLMQRALSAKNEAIAVHSSYISAILYIVIGLLPVWMGIAMYEINPTLTIPETEMILPWLAMKFLHPALTGIFVAGLVAALMSSADSALLAAASMVGYNCVKYFKPDASEEFMLKVTRLFVPITAVVSLLLALYASTIYKLMVIAWTIFLVGLFAPYAAAYFWKKANHTGAVASSVAGFASWVAFIYYYLPVTSEANVGVIEEGVVYMEWATWDAVYLASVPGFVISVITLIVVSLLTQKHDPAKPLADVDGNPLPVKDYLGLMHIKYAVGDRWEKLIEGISKSTSA